MAQPFKISSPLCEICVYRSRAAGLDACLYYYYTGKHRDTSPDCKTFERYTPARARELSDKILKETLAGLATGGKKIE